ncbi:fungal mating-type pheromone [Coprinopsis cinerea okayama7|uniref:Fungal mating-type pheromone n=1 Tax=Coprinopsis cinerea (strain Okayama-7 / 130 / ATCC MYA-4618 / FGSC 9003) TaxID=240176 RepID=D6RM42_COPC7|nr:fungal mating-type pheromone [Coprinopsis cinerea okayama7\|eukprot:XP_002911465.1 fungal mating-type pheromone [Coprinopsis cinerea okayama7\
MDAFATLFSTVFPSTNVDDITNTPTPSVPVEEETGGGRGTGAYCHQVMLSSFELGLRYPFPTRITFNHPSASVHILSNIIDISIVMKEERRTYKQPALF